MDHSPWNLPIADPTADITGLENLVERGLATTMRLPSQSTPSRPQPPRRVPYSHRGWVWLRCLLHQGSPRRGVCVEAELQLRAVRASHDGGSLRCYASGSIWCLRGQESVVSNREYLSLTSGEVADDLVPTPLGGCQHERRSA